LISQRNWSQPNVPSCFALTLAMKVNRVPFLTTISKNIHYHTAQYVKGQMSDIYRTCLSQVFCIYKMGGFWVEHAQCDNKFRHLMDPLTNDFGVEMNYANPQENVLMWQRVVHTMSYIRMS
jgi:hypothetical protein